MAAILMLSLAGAGATRSHCEAGPSTPTGGGDLMIGRKKSPETEIGFLNVRLHQIRIRRRIRTYLAEGYNFVIVSYVFALKKNAIFQIYISVSVSVAAVLLFVYKL